MLITILVPDGVSSHLSCPVAGGVPLWSIPSLYFWERTESARVVNTMAKAAVEWGHNGSGLAK